MPEVAIEFADGRVLLPAWILETISYFDMEEEQVDKLRKACAELPYARFLAACQAEGSKIEQREARDSLNEIQQRYVATAQRQIREARERLNRLARHARQALALR